MLSDNTHTGMISLWCEPWCKLSGYHAEKIAVGTYLVSLCYDSWYDVLNDCAMKKSYGKTHTDMMCILCEFRHFLFPDQFCCAFVSILHIYTSSDVAWYVAPIGQNSANTCRMRCICKAPTSGSILLRGSNQAAHKTTHCATMVRVLLKQGSFRRTTSYWPVIENTFLIVVLVVVFEAQLTMTALFKQWHAILPRGGGAILSWQP